MFKKVLKWVAFTALVLWVGQVSVAHNTLGGHFSEGTGNALRWTASEFRKSSLYSAMAKWPVIGPWFDGGVPKLPKKKVAMKSEPTEYEKNTLRRETISPSDRESLMRLLQ